MFLDEYFELNSVITTFNLPSGKELFFANKCILLILKQVNML